MTTQSLRKADVAGIKRALRATMDIKSSHLSEALAAAFGFGSQAAMTAALKEQPGGVAMIVHEGAFASRLDALGHGVTPALAQDYLRAALATGPRELRKDKPMKAFGKSSDPVHQNFWQARAALMLRSRLLGLAALAFGFVEDAAVRKFAMVGKELRFNRHYALSITYDQMQSVVIMAAAHHLLGHAARREDRDPGLWNVACEVALTSSLWIVLRDALPPGTQFTGWFTADSTAEHVYSALEVQETGGTIRYPRTAIFDIQEGPGGEPALLSASFLRTPDGKLRQDMIVLPDGVGDKGIRTAIGMIGSAVLHGDPDPASSARR